jgi:hypothetical protein
MAASRIWWQIVPGRLPAVREVPRRHLKALLVAAPGLGATFVPFAVSVAEVAGGDLVVL